MKKTNSNKQAESNFPLLTEIVCIWKKIFTATTDTMLTAEFSLSIDYLRSLESATISFIVRDASLSLMFGLIRNEKYHLILTLAFKNNL